MVNNGGKMNNRHFVGRCNLLKKQRGQKRKLRTLLKRIDNQVVFPINVGEEEYMSFPLPCSFEFVDSPKTSAKVKREICQVLISKTESLILSKPIWAKNCRIVCLLTYPDISSSQIIIFYNDDYFNIFFKRPNKDGFSDPNQIWIPINNESFKRKICVSKSMKEKGYYQKCFDEEDNSLVFTNEIWVFGELDVDTM